MARMGRPPKKKNTSTSRHSDWVSEKKIPKVKKDPEEIAGKVELPDDNKEYPSPKKDLVFRRKWNQFVPILMERPNFHETVLSQLEVLCDLYVEYEALAKFIRTQGYTYEAFGRQGKAVKPFPQVAQFNKVKHDIHTYTKMLELHTAKMKPSTKQEEKQEWK